MPLLSEADVRRLLARATIYGRCPQCGHSPAVDYCRSCDEFYWIHAAGCPLYETKHFGHRLTLVPFIEVR